MDAVKFLKEKTRLCNSVSDCAVCPLNVHCTPFGDPEKAVATIEEWSKANPEMFRVGDIVERKITNTETEEAIVLVPKTPTGKCVLLMKGYSCPQYCSISEWKRIESDLGNNSEQVRKFVTMAAEAMRKEEYK